KVAARSMHGYLSGDSAEPAVLLRIREANDGSLRPVEIARALFGLDLHPHEFVRLGCWYIDPSGHKQDPLDGIAVSRGAAANPPDAAAGTGLRDMLPGNVALETVLARGSQEG
ncbi:MAG: hypothetical protein ACE5JI_01795, partial [Acidobacteriota bacterium]